jgi:hypothetical protein
MRLDEETLAAVHEAEPDRAMDGAVVPRDPQVLHGDLQAPDVVVAHAVVLRQDDLDLIAADLQLPAQTEHHVRQPANFSHGCAFSSNLNDIHKLPSFVISGSWARRGSPGRPLFQNEDRAAPARLFPLSRQMIAAGDHHESLAGPQVVGPKGRGNVVQGILRRHIHAAARRPGCRCPGFRRRSTDGSRDPC